MNSRTSRGTLDGGSLLGRPVTRSALLAEAREVLDA
jgi:hypothetical protein